MTDDRSLVRPQPDNAEHGVTGRASRDARRPTPASPPHRTHPANHARLNLRLALQNRYDSRPAPELRENDVALLAGLGVTF